MPVAMVYSTEGANLEFIGFHTADMAMHFTSGQH